MATVRLLLLSAGTTVGHTILAMLADRRHAVTLVATSAVADEPALFDCDVVHLVPPTLDADAREQALLDVLARERIDLAVPCSDDDLVACARLLERHPRLAPRLLCGAPAMAAVLVDRFACHEFCRVHGLPYAASIAGTSPAEQAAFIATHGLPAIAKPRRGSCAADAVVVSTAAQLSTMLARDGFIAQAFVGDRAAVADHLRALDEDGVPLFHQLQGLTASLQAIVAPDGEVTALFATRRVRQLRRSRWVAVDDDPAAVDLGLRVARAFAAAGWRGPLEIECLVDTAGERRIHALRGRFVGDAMDRWLVGFDGIGAAVTAFTGAVLPFDAKPAPVPVEAFESRVGRGADPSHVDALSRERVWRRAA